MVLCDSFLSAHSQKYYYQGQLCLEKQVCGTVAFEFRATLPLRKGRQAPRVIMVGDWSLNHDNGAIHDTARLQVVSA